MLIAIYILLGLVVLGAAVSLLTWALYVPLVARAFGETPWLLARTYPAAAVAEPCEFRTADGLVLRASYLHSMSPRRLGVIAFCHEFGGDRWGASPYVSDLRQRGFDILTFDFRNHGMSDALANYGPMPWVSYYELADVRAAIDYLASRHDADPRGIGLMGVSRGATAALCAAALDHRVRAVVTDGAFPTVALQKHYMRRFMEIYIPVRGLGKRLPDWVLSSYCQWGRFLVGLRRNCRFIHVDQIVRSVRQPVFMIHGERDAYIPARVARSLRAALGGRSKFWIVPGVRHNEAINEVPDEYHRRIARFFLKTLHGSVHGYAGSPAERLSSLRLRKVADAGKPV